MISTLYFIWSLVTLVGMLSPQRRAFAFGFSLSGPLAVFYGLMEIVLRLYLGYGLWRLRETARRLAIGYGAYTLLSSLLAFFNPSKPSLFVATLHEPSTLILLLPFMLLSYVPPSVVIWFLIKRRSAFGKPGISLLGS
jgi:hypothetical protein